MKTLLAHANLIIVQTQVSVCILDVGTVLIESVLIGASLQLAEGQSMHKAFVLGLARLGGIGCVVKFWVPLVVRTVSPTIASICLVMLHNHRAA